MQMTSPGLWYSWEDTGVSLLEEKRRSAGDESLSMKVADCANFEEGERVAHGGLSEEVAVEAEVRKVEKNRGAHLVGESVPASAKALGQS